MIASPIDNLMRQHGISLLELALRARCQVVDVAGALDSQQCEALPAILVGRIWVALEQALRARGWDGDMLSLW